MEETNKIQQWLDAKTQSFTASQRQYLWNRYDFLIWRFGFILGAFAASAVLIISTSLWVKFIM